MKATAALLLAVLIVLPSCEPITGSRDSFSVRAEDDHLVLTNGLTEPVHYWALEEEGSALVDALEGYTSHAKQARVYWWTGSEGYGDYLVIDL